MLNRGHQILIFTNAITLPERYVFILDISSLRKVVLYVIRNNRYYILVKHEIAWSSHISNMDARLILLYVTEQICQRDDRISA